MSHPFHTRSVLAPEIYSGHSYPEPVQEAPVVVSGPHRGWPGSDESSSASLSGKRHQTICGLSVAVFWLCFAIVGIIVVGGAVGGGIGGVITAQDNQKLATAQQSLSAAQSSASAAMSSAAVAYSQGFVAGQAVHITASAAAVQATASSSTSTTPSTQTSTVTSAPPAVTPTSDCSQHNATEYITTNNNRNPARFVRVCKTAAAGGIEIKTLFQGVVVSFSACIDMCDSYNAWNGINTTNIASFNLNTFGSVAVPVGLCSCRRAKLGDFSISSSTAFDSAYLVGTFNSAQVVTS